MFGVCNINGSCATNNGCVCIINVWCATKSMAIVVEKFFTSL